MGAARVVLGSVSRYNAGTLHRAGRHEPPMSQDSSPLTDDAFLMALRRELLKFARLQLRNDALAEDMVQEALAAALAGERGFAGRAALKTWIFAILRNKIVDHFRASGRVTNVSALAPEEAGLDQAFEALFKANEHWARDSRPAPWGDPEEALVQQRFWVVFDACLNHLPASTARVFMMREFLELETAEICSALEITAGNCNVILHRARNGLRRCLDKNWFSPEPIRC